MSKRESSWKWNGPAKLDLMQGLDLIQSLEEEKRFGQEKRKGISKQKAKVQRQIRESEKSGIKIQYKEVGNKIQSLRLCTSF